MAALDTVAEYVTEARSLLQDTVDAPYRYSDADIVSALSISFLEARRLRPDIFLKRDVQSFATNDTTEVDMDEQYRMCLVYYIVGHMHLRDEESTQDARASTFLNKFTSQMLSIPS